MSIRSDFDLDISDALSSIDALQRAVEDSLTTAGESLQASLNDVTVVVNADTEAFVETTTTAAENLDISVVVNADTATVAPEIEASVADVVLDVPVDPDTTALAPEIQAAIDAFEAVVSIDQGALAAEIERGMGLADFDSFDGELRIIVEQAIAAGMQSGAGEIPDFGTLELAIASAVSEGLGEGYNTDTAGLDDATESAESLGDATEEAFNGGAVAAAGFGTAFELATGNIGDVGQKIKGVFGAATGTVVAVTGATFALFKQGQTTEQAIQQLNDAFGDQAERVKQVDIGGLNGDLADLAVKAGGSSDAMFTATASIGRMGTTAGVSKDEIATTAEQIQALGLRAAVMNPKLGDAGAVTERLSKALQSGRTRALVPFGLSLETAEVKAKALEIALADGRSTVTKFDTAAAGAAIITEKLGDKLGKDFSKGADSATIRLRSLKSAIQEGLGNAGVGIVEPLIDAAEALAPIAVGLATTIGDLIGAIVPVATEIVERFAPAVVSAGEALGKIVDAAVPVVEVIGTGLAGVLAPVGFLLKAFFEGISNIPGPVLTAAAALAGLSLSLKAVGVAIGLLHAINPVLLGITAALAVVGAAFTIFSNDTAPKAGASAEELGDALFKVTTAADGTSKQVILLGKNFEEALKTDNFGNFAEELEAESSRLSKSLGDVGVTADTLVANLNGGEAGVDAFSRKLVEAVEAPANFDAILDKVGISMDDLIEKLVKGEDAASDFKMDGENWAALRATFGEGADAALAYANRLTELRDIFEATQGKLEEDVVARLNAIGVTERLTAAEALQLKDKKELLTLYPQVIARIEEEDAATLAAAEAKKADAEAAAASTFAWRDLGKAVLAAGGNVDKALESFDTSKLSAENVKAFTAEVVSAFEGLVSSVESSLPKTADAFKDFQSAIDKAKGTVETTSRELDDASGKIADAQERYDTAVADAGEQSATRIRKAQEGLVEAQVKAADATGKGVKAAGERVAKAQKKYDEAVAASSDGSAKSVRNAAKKLAEAIGEKGGAAAAFKKAQADLEKATSPQRIIDNLNKQAKSVRDYSANIAKLFASGNARAAQEALKLGPQAGSAFAKSLIDGGPKIEAAANLSLLGVDRANADMLERVRGEFGPQLAGAMETITVDANGKFHFSFANQGTDAELQANLDHIVDQFGLKSQAFKDAASGLAGGAYEAFLAQMHRFGLASKQGLEASRLAFKLALPGLGEAGRLAAEKLAFEYGIPLQELPLDTARQFGYALLTVKAAQPGLKLAGAENGIAIAQALTENLDEVPKIGTRAFEKLVSEIVTLQPNLSREAARAALTAATALNTSLTTNLDGTPKIIEDSIGGAVDDGGKAGAEKAKAAGSTIATALGSGIDEALPVLTKTGSDAGAKTATAYSTDLIRTIQANNGFLQIAAMFQIEQIGNPVYGGAAAAASISGASVGNLYVSTLNSTITSFSDSVQFFAGLQISALGNASIATSPAALSVKAGKTIGENLAAGIVAGIAAGQAGVDQAARNAIRAAEGAANAEAGIDSPSKLFAILGGYLSEGVAVGIRRETDQVVDAATGMVNAAAGAVSGVTTSGVSSQGLAAVGPPSLSGGGTTNQFSVEVVLPDGFTAGSRDEAKEIGAGIGDGFIDTLTRRGIIASVRAG